MTDQPAAKKEQLVAELKKMGIKAGDALMVHSSFKSLGPVDGGPEAVIDAFLEVLTPKGLFVVPALTATFANSSWEQMRLYSYDPKETPSRVGVITDKAWRRPNAFRSNHPTHSIAAIGNRAQELAKGDSLRTFDKNGPYGRYVKWGANLFFLGTTLGCNTTLHVAEDWAELPYMEQDVPVKVKNVDGSTRIEKVAMSPNGHRNFYAPDDKSPIVKVFYDRGLIREGKLANAQVRLIGARDVMNTALQLFYDDPAFLLCENPECAFCLKGRRECLEQLPRIRQTIDRLKADGWCSF